MTKPNAPSYALQADARPLQSVPMGSLFLARAKAIAAARNANLTGDDVGRIDALLIIIRTRNEYRARFTPTRTKGAA